ncbi:MAG: SDR family NAD(P)-dependent oxidoreductase [Caldilineaceae bacterium]
MNAKTVLITGANAGIGLRAAHGLAQQGHTVVMLARNAERGEVAQQQVIEQSGNPNVDLIIADMASQSSIRQAVTVFEERHSRLDALINNAANFDISMKRPQLTAEGVETIFATNHLGPFLLTNLLVDRLKAAAPSRVINIASKGLLTYPFLSIEFDNLNGQRKFSAQHAYYHAKLAQVIFTLDLAERLKDAGVSVNCIRVPSVRLDAGRYDHVPALMRSIYQFKMRFALPPEAVAGLYVDMATADKYAPMTGQYVDETGRSVSLPRNAQDHELRAKLWQVSEELTQQQRVVSA